MGFSAKQVRQLRKQIHSRHLRSRETNGRELTYIEGWHAIDEANRIFGFDGWNRETVESRCITAREVQGAFRALYAARVRITVRAEDVAVVREGSGTGEAHAVSYAEAHDMALKSAETDATKRALATFGRPFGLALHLGIRPPRTEGGRSSPQPVNSRRQATAMHDIPNRGQGALIAKGNRGSQLPPPREALAIRSARDLPTPPFVSSLAPKEAQAVAQQPRDREPAENVSPVGAAASAVQPANPGQPDSSGNASGAPIPEDHGPVHDDAGQRIDKSVLTHGAVRRYRDKAHLRFVAVQPCLICSRHPSDAHHLRFAQPRALGRKVSDQFTVPLCRLHHRELHQAGKEQGWWDAHGIDPLPIAGELWSESRLRRLGKRGSAILNRVEP